MMSPLRVGYGSWPQPFQWFEATSIVPLAPRLRHGDPVRWMRVTPARCGDQ